MTRRGRIPSVDGPQWLSAGQYDRLGDVAEGEVWADGDRFTWVPEVPDRCPTDVTDSVAPLLRRSLVEVGGRDEDGRALVVLTGTGRSALEAYTSGLARLPRPASPGRIATPDPDGQPCPHCRVRYQPRHYRPGSNKATDLCSGESQRPRRVTS